VLRDERLATGLRLSARCPMAIAAALGMARRLGLDSRVKTAELMPAGAARLRLLALALIVARVTDAAAKLATARQLDAATASHSLGAVLGLGTVGVNELYAALDWLLAPQPKIEAKLARRHLGEGTLVLYDVTSSYLEGRCCPIAVEVFAGNTADPSTLKLQIDKLRRRFGLRRVVLVGDRGMITQARIT
jgi:hypothetical protein